MVWRLVTGKIATLQEIETYWSLSDLYDANDVLDYQQALPDKEVARMKRN